MNAKIKMMADFSVNQNKDNRKKAKIKKIIFITIFTALFAFRLNENEFFDFIRLIIEVVLS